MSGRAQVKAPQTDVRIALQDPGGADRGHASIRPARSRIEPVSNVDAADEEPFDETDGRSGRRINAEDLEPPAEEATALLPQNNPRTRRTASDTGRAGWNARQGASKAGAGSSPATRVKDDGDNATDRRSPSDDDDGPNPLPPAIESRATPGGAPAACTRGRESRPDRTNRARSLIAAEQRRRPNWA